MKDPIEELFQKNQHGFDENPRTEIWNKIEEKLNNQPTTPITHKTVWWKYAIAASVVLFIGIGIFVLMNQNATSNKVQQPQIVLEEREITEENATEVLDKLEETKISVAIVEQEAPEEEKQLIIPEPVYIEEEPIIEEFYHPAEVHDYPSEKRVSGKKTTDIESSDINESKEVNKDSYGSENDDIYIEEQRLGNRADAAAQYPTHTTQQLQVPLKNHFLNYDLIYKDSEKLTFINSSVSFPNQIVFKKVSDSIQVIYSGAKSKINSRESKLIQRYINDNKSTLINNFSTMIVEQKK